MQAAFKIGRPKAFFQKRKNRFMEAVFICTHITLSLVHHKVDILFKGKRPAVNCNYIAAFVYMKSGIADGLSVYADFTYMQKPPCVFPGSVSGMG